MTRLVSLPLALCLFAVVARAAEPTFDINQPASSQKPAPDGMTFIDQGKYDPRLKGYRTPDGFKVGIVAEEPAIINPVGITFGPDGALFVLEWVPDENTWPETPEKVTYKDGTTRTVATMKKKVKDLVKVLTWDEEKKAFTNPRIILEDELPSSILIHDGWLYTSGRGTVRRWKLADVIDGKNPQAKPDVIAKGFCGFHHHQVSGLTIGNDGWLYITSGDDDNVVEGSDGSRATVLRTGAVFRCRPDGSKMQVYSVGYRNPYRDVAFDDRGNIFHADNDNEDGSKFTGCRLMHVAEASDFGWRLFTGARCCKPDPVRGAAFGELPGKLPAMLKTGRGAPAGLLIYNDTQLPEFYRGWLYYPDVFRKLVRAYRVEPAGSTFAVANEFEFLKCDDPLFRPCQMIIGPDGAIYVCDWRTDSGGAGRLFGDGRHGRIYRITWAGGKLPGGDEAATIPTRATDTWAKAVKGTDEELVAGLTSEDFTTRAAVQKELVCRGEKNRAALLKLFQDAEQPLTARLAALGALQSLWHDDVRAAFLKALADGEADVRRLAADGLALNGTTGDAEVQAALLKALGDKDAAVKRAVALAMGRLNAEGAADSLLASYKFDDGKDVYLTDGYLRALERCGKVGIERLVGLAKSGDDPDRAHAVAAFLALRTADGAAAIPEMLRNPHLTTDQRVALVRSYANYLLDPPVSLEPLLDYLADRPKEPLAVQAAAIETLALAGQLMGARSVNLLTTLLDADGADARLTAIHAIETARFAEAAPRLAQALADRERAPAERVAIIKALRVLNNKEAAAALKGLFEGPEPAFLRAEALRTLAALDPTAARPVAVKLLDQSDALLQSEAVQVLGADPAGAKLVGQRFVEKKLLVSLLPQVSDALRKHAGKDAELAKLQTEVMKGGLLLSLAPGQVETVRQLVLTKGDPRRGKSIYLSAKGLNCVNCHKLEGVGGQVGPDLTRLWETATIEKIMESIIEPSKEIKEGFQSFKLTTKNGQTFNGLKVVDKPAEVVLRDAEGKDVRVARNDIDELVALKTSLMPDNAVAQLSFDQFIDLVAFLKSRDAQESLRGTVTEFRVVGPFGADLRAEYGPERNAGADETYQGEGGVKVAWQPRSAEANGLLNLRAVFDKDRVSAYAFTNVFSPKAQRATLYLGADDTVRVWVNGEMVHEHAAPRTAVPDNDRVRVDLKEGWNPVLVKVANRLDAHGLYLRFQGEGVRAAVKKE
jgi:quinoprotein glucose dehydrogenase